MSDDSLDSPLDLLAEEFADRHGLWGLARKTLLNLKIGKLRGLVSGHIDVRMLKARCFLLPSALPPIIRDGQGICSLV